MTTRRYFCQTAGGLLAGAWMATRVRAGEIDHMQRMQHDNMQKKEDPRAGAAEGYTPVVTPNGVSLPYKMKDGVKEFHLVAEEIEHEFAPGTKNYPASRARCWGYNGRTPGPTIEAVEGDRVRILVTNRLPEATSIHWHGVILPSGMDGVAGLNQPPIPPGQTYAYEFALRQHGTHMYHPHGDEMVQMAVGMMGMFIIHPSDGEKEPIDRDFCILLHNWALHPGTYRPDPSIMQDFDLWTFNSKVFPATAPLVCRTGQRVRIRIANLSMWNHPIHLHGHKFWVTGSDGGRWPKSAWRPETTEIVGVGQTRDIEFITDNPGDWAFHCHMSHHTMNAMGHGIPNPLGVDQRGVAERIRKILPGYVAMGEGGMSEHAMHIAGGAGEAAHGGMQHDMADMEGTDHSQHGAGGLRGPRNTLPMMVGEGPFGPIEMGGMFTVVKIRDDITSYEDPGWYKHPKGTIAWRVG